jgi:hypothetical protein
VTVVCGTEAAGFASLVDFCREITAGHQFYQVGSGTTTLDDLRETVSSAMGKRTEGVSIVFVRSAAPWTSEWIESTIERLNRLTRTKEFVKVVFAADPERLWNVLSSTSGAGLVGEEQRALVVSASPWRDAAIRQFLEDSNLGGDRAVRDELKRLTGNWPGLIGEFRIQNRSSPSVLTALSRLSDLWSDEAWRARMLAAWGMNVEPIIARVLRDFAIVGDATADDLSGVLTGTTRSEVERVINWAELLALVEPRGDGKWAVESTLQRMLTHK